MGMEKYTPQIEELKQSGQSLDEAIDYLIRKCVAENRVDPIGTIFVIMQVYGISLLKAKELVETRCHQIKLELGLYTPEQLAQFAETQKIITRLGYK